MDYAEFFRDKAAHCREMAGRSVRTDRSTAKGLLALALEFDARALALAAGEAAAREIEPDRAAVAEKNGGEE
jgi:hypothetical protein